MASDSRFEAAPGLSLTGAQIRTVRAIVERVAPGAEIWVFGSRATGRARPFSDLDLLLTRPATLSWRQRAELRENFDASDLPFLVDVLAVSDLAGEMADRVADERRLLADPFDSGA